MTVVRLAVADPANDRDDRRVDTRAFAERLALARAVVGTQEDVARTLGMGTRLLQRWEAAEVRPRVEKLHAFCVTTGASADWLLGLDERIPPSVAQLLGDAEGTERELRRRIEAQRRSARARQTRTR